MVEDVVVALPLVLRHNARLFEQVVAHGAAADGVVGGKQDLDELADARRVLVAHRLGVAEGFQDWVLLYYFCLHWVLRTHMFNLLVTSSQRTTGRNIHDLTDKLFRRLCLSRTRLSADYANL